MVPSLRAVLVFSLAAGAVTAVACGGNVIVDGAAGAAGAGGTGGVPTSSSGSTTGFAGSTTSFGGSVTTTFTTTTTTLTTTLTGKCTDPQDENIFQQTVAFPIEAMCALANLGNDAGLLMCLKGNVGLTESCEICLVNDLQCAVEHCATQCSQAPSSQGCASCRQTNCEPAFVACSGQPHDTGITNCATVYGGGPSLTPWQRGFYASDFTTSSAQSAYTAYDSCACAVGVGACAGICGAYCGGQDADPMCGMCLSVGCAMQAAACTAN